MIKETLNLLDDLVTQNITKNNRSTKLLKNPNSKTQKGWFIYVPPCFNDALDIKKTERVGRENKLVWTQGSSFFFKRGDTLYDTPEAYRIWSEALKSINYCLHIKKSSSAECANANNERFSGSITFSIMVPNDSRSKIAEHSSHTISQDLFVRFLIAGPDILTTV